LKINNKIKDIFTSIEHGIITLNSHGIIINFSKNIEKIINIPHGNLESQRIQTMFNEKEHRKLSDFLNKNTRSSISLNSIKNDTLILSISYDKNNENKTILIYNEGEVEKRFDDINKLAFHDHLTNLPNINLFNDRAKIALNQAKRNNEQVFISYMDIDDFKKINDTFGHHVGDEILIEFARRLKKTIRNTDTLSRIGGDEFLLLAQNITSINDMDLIIKRMIEECSQPFIIKNNELNISLSIGISNYPKDAKDLKTLIIKADKAMYKCKNSKKLNYKYHAG